MSQSILNKEHWKQFVAFAGVFSVLLCFSFRKQLSGVSRRRSRRSRWRWSRSKWKPCERPAPGILIQAHTHTSRALLSSDRFPQLPSPLPAAPAHSRSSSKQTSCASGCVQLSCLCHHLLHTLNHWGWTVKSQGRETSSSCCFCFLWLNTSYLLSKLCLKAVQLGERFYCFCTKSTEKKRSICR